MVKVKANTQTVAAPQSKEEAEKYIFDIGRLQRENALDTAAYNDAIENLRAKYSDAFEQRNGEIAEKTLGLEKWAQANRTEIFGKNKSVIMEFGRLIFRKNPPKVKINKLQDVIEQCKALGKYYRVKYSLDKELMLAEPEEAGEIAGVTIMPGDEVFSVEPNEQILGGENA